MRKKIFWLFFIIITLIPSFALAEARLEILSPKSKIIHVGEEVKVEFNVDSLFSSGGGFAGASCEAFVRWGDGTSDSFGIGNGCDIITGPVFNRCVCSGIATHQYTSEDIYEIELTYPDAFSLSGTGSTSLEIQVITPTSTVVTSINPLAVTGLATSIQSFVDRFFYGAGAWWIVILVAIFLMIGGYYIFFSYGDPKRIARGKRIVILTLIGFAIILIARGIIWFLESVLGRR